MMSKISDIYSKLKREVSSNPRQCDMCGCIETMDNLILLYTNGLFLCDDCVSICFYERFFEDD